MCHSSHSNFIKKCIENNIIDNSIVKCKLTNNRRNGVVYYDTKKKEPAKITDPRFQNPAFKRAVKTVLEYLGFESTMGNFNLVEAKKVKINWLEFARNIQGKNLEPEYIDIDKFYKSCEEIERGKHVTTV